MAVIGAGLAVAGAWVFAGLLFVGQRERGGPGLMAVASLLGAVVLTLALIDAAAGA